MQLILQTLYESSIAFGMRKALQTEQGKGDMEGRIGTLEADTKDFERQVRAIAVPLYSLTGYNHRLPQKCLLIANSGFTQYHHSALRADQQVWSCLEDAASLVKTAEIYTTTKIRLCWVYTDFYDLPL